MTSAASKLPADLPDDPLPLFREWFDTAVASGSMVNPDAMTIATIADGDRVAARVVLCKEIVSDPGYLVFFTNFASAKGKQLEANPNVAAVFYWDALGRQARIEGVAGKSPAADSDEYFATRDRDSRIGAWTSAQSQPIASHAALLEKHRQTRRRFNAAGPDSAVPRPPHWGGYRIGIRAIELWQQGEARLHDRARWERELERDVSQAGFRAGPWRVVRLQP
jgi:pyridoxamine 5'-phosphate oxidase